MSDFDITIAYGNTIELIINLDIDGGFTENDKVLLKIRRWTGAIVLSKILSIYDNVAHLSLTSQESKQVPYGNNFWDITVYINAVIEDGEIISADEVVTPFISAKFNVKNQESRDTIL